MTADIYLPAGADPDKVRRLGELGARLTFCEDYEAAHHAAVEAARSTGARYVSPYNDPDVIAADGVIGLEIRGDLPAMTGVVVCLGGGGLASGIAGVCKALDPAVTVMAVEAAASPTFTTWRQAGRPVPVEIGRLTRVPLKHPHSGCESRRSDNGRAHDPEAARATPDRAGYTRAAS
jgi:threonine dehydratase